MVKNYYADKAFSLSDDDRESLARALFHLVSDYFAMAIKGYSFHWNVVAPNFEDLHEMFGDDYSSLLDNADLVAERIRALGFSAPGSIGIFGSTSSIRDQNAIPDWRSMIAEWIEDNDHMVREARAAQQLADSMGDNNTLAMLDGLILHHEKRAWMFRSIINETPDRHPGR